MRLRTRVALVGACGLLAAGCGAPVEPSGLPTLADQASDESTEVILDPCSRPNLTTVEPGALTFATSAGAAPPYFMTDEPSDELGFEAAYAYELAAQMGFRGPEVTWEVVEARDILSGEFTDYDIAIGGFTSRPEEFAEVEFSIPFWQVEMSVLTSDNDVRNVLVGKTTDDGRTPQDLTWAASDQGMAGPWLVEQQWLLALGVRPARGGEQVLAQWSGSDVRVVDRPTLAWLVETTDLSIRPLGAIEVPDEQYALVMVAGNPLVPCVNAAVADLSAGPRLRILVDRWLDPTRWDGG